MGQETGSDVITISQKVNSDDKNENETTELTQKLQLNATPEDPAGTKVENHRRNRQTEAVGKFFCVNITGSIEKGFFESVNDVYVRYSIVAGPDWIINSGAESGITQISRCGPDETGASRFVWNQPISIGYRSYNFYGWPQMVVSLYYYDFFGNDQILGYGCSHLPMSNSRDCSGPIRQRIKIHCLQSSSYLGQFVALITGKKPELIDMNLYARADYRSLLQTHEIGEIEVYFDLVTKDVGYNGYRSG